MLKKKKFIMECNSSFYFTISKSNNLLRMQIANDEGQTDNVINEY